MKAGSPKQANPRRLPCASMAFNPLDAVASFGGVAYCVGWALGPCAAGRFKILFKSFCFVSVEVVSFSNSQGRSHSLLRLFGSCY